MSIKQILAKAWEDCRKEGVDLSSVYFRCERRIDGKVIRFEVDIDGRAIEPMEKPQNQPDE